MKLIGFIHGLIAGFRCSYDTQCWNCGHGEPFCTCERYTPVLKLDPCSQCGGVYCNCISMDWTKDADWSPDDDVENDDWLPEDDDAVFCWETGEPYSTCDCE